MYTDDSSICAAAAHAGGISQSEGGAATAVITGGQKSYRGSTRNGTTSEDWGAYKGSFTIEDDDGGQIDWSTKAVGVASLSKPLALECPPGGTTTASIRGTDTYSDNTSICVAAVHAGVITPEKGGTVVIESAGDRTSYRGTSRNGVTSEAFGPWPRSFRFEGMVAKSEAQPANVPAPIATPPQPVALRTITAPALEITGMTTKAEQLTRSFTAPQLSITGAAALKLDHILTAPRLILQGQ